MVILRLSALGPSCLRAPPAVQRAVSSGGDACDGGGALPARLFKIRRQYGVDEAAIRSVIATAPGMAVVLAGADEADRRAPYDALDLRITQAVREGLVYTEADAVGVWETVGVRGGN